MRVGPGLRPARMDVPAGSAAANAASVGVVVRAAGPSQAANCSPFGGSAAANAASVGVRLTGFDAIVEAKIAEAQRDGAFDDLPGAGKPLALDDDRLVPEDLRMAYRILKNAGFVPPEIEERKEAADLRKLVAAAAGDAARRALARLALLEARLEARGIGDAARARLRREARRAVRARRVGASDARDGAAVLEQQVAADDAVDHPDGRRRTRSPPRSGCRSG